MGRSIWMRIGALALAVVVAVGLIAMLWNVSTPSAKVLGPGISADDQPPSPSPSPSPTSTPSSTPSSSPSSTPKPSPSKKKTTPKPTPSITTPPRNNVVTPLPPQRGQTNNWDDDDWDDDDWDD